MSNRDESDDEMAVVNARSLLSDYEDCTVEVKDGALKHAIEELRIAREALPDD